MKTFNDYLKGKAEKIDEAKSPKSKSAFSKLAKDLEKYESLIEKLYDEMPSDDGKAIDLADAAYTDLGNAIGKIKKLIKML